MLEKDGEKSTHAFRTQLNIYDEAFFKKIVNDC